MKNKRWLARWISGIHLAAALAVSMNMPKARGQEEIPPLPPGHRVEHLIVFDARQMQAIERAGEALRNEIGPGFTITVTKTAPCVPSNCNGAASSCDEFCAFESPTGRFVKQACPCVVTGECQCNGVCRCAGQAGSPVSTVCGSECLASCAGQTCEAKCGEEECDIALAHAEEANEHHERFHQRFHLHHEPLDLIHALVELSADRAAARAELESRREASAKMASLYETLAELIAANAALEAKLEAQVEHTKLAEKVAELAADNARLKTHVELAGSRAEASQQSISLTLENERLKLRLADLEHRQAISEASQTAERTIRERKAR